MNLLEQIRARWAADSTLNGLVPAATKFQTGVFQYDGVPPYPFATVLDPFREPEEQAKGTSVDRVIIRITVYDARGRRDRLDTIAKAVNAAFNRAHFDLSGSDEVLTMERAGQEAVQDEDDDWYMVMDFSCRVYLADGV